MRKNIYSCIVGVFVLLLLFSLTEKMEAAPSVSEINGGPVRLIYDMIGHYELNYIGNTNNYDYWNSSGTSKIVSKKYKDRTDLPIATENNSTAVIRKTDSKSKIVKAFLIWETRSEKGITQSINFLTPNNSINSIIAQYACKDIRTNDAGQEYSAVYTMAADVTNIVCSANGGYGMYTVADIPVWSGAGNGVSCGGESVASWQLVVVEESPDFPLRTISLNVLSQYFFNENYVVNVDFADASAPNGVITASIMQGTMNIDSAYAYDGVGYADDYNYHENGLYFRYKTQARGLYKNGVCINDRDRGSVYQYGSSAVGAVRMHLYDDKRRSNNLESQKLTIYGEGTNAGNHTFLYGVAIDIFAYDVKFDGNGADSGSMNDLSCVYGREYDLPENKFRKGNYEFAGWNTKADGSGESYTNLGHVQNLTSTEKSVTLYAQWSPKGYVITLDHQNATTYGTGDYFEWYGKGNYTDRTCRTPISRITVPQKKGNSFGGYYTGPNGSGKQYIKADGTITATASTFTADTTLYAYWKPKVSKITLDHQGATSAGTTQFYQKFNIGNFRNGDCTTPISNITNPVKRHYTFQGYYTSRNGEGQRIVDAAGKILDIYTLFEDDTTLYAYWEPVSYTIYLDNQDPTTTGDKKFYEKYGVANYSEIKNVTTAIGNKTVTFQYTGSLQAFEAPFDGTYTLTAYGAGGASNSGYASAGGKASGTVYLKKGERLWINVGGAGSGTTGGYNGGGNGGVVYTSPYTFTAQGGGGSTDFLRDGYQQANRILVAGGGGGAIYVSNGKTINGGSSTDGEGNWGSVTYATNTDRVIGVDMGNSKPIQDIPSKLNQGDVIRNDEYGYSITFTLLQKGAHGQGATGGGGGYIGGGYSNITVNSNATYMFSQGLYIVGCGAGSSYVKGVDNGILYGLYASSGKYYFYDRANKTVTDLISYGGNNHGKATISYTDYNTTTELKEATSVTIPVKKGYRFGGYYTGRNGTGTRYVDESGNILSNPTTFTNDTTLYAYWIADGRDIYRIAFHGNGATGGRMSLMECAFHTTYTLQANAFTKAGYTFLGWNTKPNGTGNAYADRASVRNLAARSGETITLYAQWRVGSASYRVNHYLEKIDGGWELQSTDNRSGTTNSIVTPSSFAKTYTGFTYKHAEVKGVPTTGAVIMPDGSLTINLYYARNSYKLTLNKDSGIASVSGAGTYKYQEKVNLKAVVGTGYSWNGWVGTYHFSEKNRQFTMPANHVSLTATTGSLTFVITLDNQNPTTYGTRNYYEKYGVGNYTTDACTTPISNIIIPKKTGYTFYGYYTGRNGGGTQYVTADGKITATAVTFTKDTTLYAYWKPVTYVVRFEGNGATGGSMPDFRCTYGELCRLPKNAFTKTHYAFQSWNTKPDGSGTAYVNESSVENLTNVPNGVITLYAQWTPNKYTIRFDANGGEGYMPDLTVSYDEVIKLPIHTFTRNNGYGDSTFLGWNILADTREVRYTDGGEVVNATEEDGSIVVFYAIWDDCPWIQATDQYYSLEDAKNGFITYEELISHAQANDREDGANIPPGTNPDTGTMFAIIDYAETDFTGFTSDGSVTETLMVVDHVGNSYKQMITVYIVDTEPKVIKPEGTTRFINEKYYRLPYEEGGLEENSVWKTDAEYREVIEDAFRRSRENDPEMTFYFNYETILEMKQFVEENGIGNSIYDEALERFYEQFMAPNDKTAI